MIEHFVARDAELARLGAFLDLALQGRGQICLLSGDAGAGKSALAVEFAHQAQAQHREIIAAAGICDPQMGSELPYAPFREVLTTLAGSGAQPARRAISVENTTRVGKLMNFTMEALLEFGPDLVTAFIPGSGLALKTGKFLFDKTGLKAKFANRLTRKDRETALATAARLNQDQLFEQYSNVISRLSQKSPLILIIEDLHWADSGSLDLLFRLSRRLESSRLMIIGTYRPHETSAALSDEGISLAKITDELKRYRGDIVLDLNRTDVASRRAFVDAYLDSEPNRLDAEFRRKLYAHTQGLPLFTVELLRDFRERGILAKDAQERWIVARSPDWDHLPARVEGVIAGRIRSLEDELRQDLTTASVEGIEFTAEVIAMLNQADVRQQVQQLSGVLQKTYQLVEGQAVHRIGQQRISRYRFTHHLFQRYLYNSLDPVEASYFHEAVGIALETLYTDRADEIAAQLAHHFERAEASEKAVRYLSIAAEQAAAIYANQAALDYIQRGLTLVDPEKDADRFALLAIRERIYDLMGQRDLQRADLDELTRLAEKLTDRQHKGAEIALRRSKLALDVSDYTTAIQEARNLIDLLQSDPLIQEAAPSLRVDAHLLWARAANLRGDAPSIGRQQLEHAEQIARQQGYLAGEARAQELLGILSWGESDHATAMTHLEKALKLARQGGDLRREWSVLNNTGIVLSALGEFSKSIQAYHDALEIVHRIGDRIGEGVLLTNLSEAHLALGQYAEARIFAEHALTLCIEVSDRIGEAIALINLSDAFRETGLYPQAEENVRRALALSQDIGYCRGEAILEDILGRIALALGNTAQAIACAEQSFNYAQELGSRSQQTSALILLGDALLVAGQFEDAQNAYLQAQTILKDPANPAVAAQALAGLASIALRTDGATGQARALDLVEAIASKAQGGSQLARSLPLRVQLCCCEILHACSDPRAGQWVEQAVEEMYARAALINDMAMRSSFLQDIPEHVVLVEFARQLALQRS